MSLPPPFHLEVRQTESVCWFRLSWGQGKRLLAEVEYPARLQQLYQDWQQAYRAFYKQLSIEPKPEPPGAPPTELRGHVTYNAPLQPSIDWRRRLRQAEGELLHEFQRWLQSADLYKIRGELAQVSRRAIEAELGEVTVFLTCSPLDLARLPWEMWQIDINAAESIRLVRSPENIQEEALTQDLIQRQRRRRGRARILAILGDETGLDFQADRAAVQALDRLAEIQFVGWQPHKTAAQVKAEIEQAIADEAGWDVLFFAGHSNEAQRIGGELAIAPNAAIAIQEIAPSLRQAKQQGLQFALFNSCSGLNLAESLIGLGFSQVAVMREPIHNRVAQDFLVKFLYGLAKHYDVQEALRAACQSLQNNINYPSAYLVPSLFCHPGATLFRLPRSLPRWKRWLRKLMPTTRLELLALLACLILTLLPSVQANLLDQRVYWQAVWRNWTHQVPPATAPPVLLVQIDQKSVQHDLRLVQPPINQGYLADLIQQLVRQNVRLLGIDYLLDRVDKETKNTDQLRQTLQTIANQQGWLVLGTLYDKYEVNNVFLPSAMQTATQSGIAERSWAMQGYVSLSPADLPQYVTLPYPDEDCAQSCPFAYLLSLIQLARQDGSLVLPSTQAGSGDLRSQFVRAIETSTNPKLNFVQQSRLWLGSLYDAVGLLWLEPVLDFSIPPDRVYEKFSAWRLLEEPPALPHLSEQVVLIGAGDYEDTDSQVSGRLDLYPLPAALRYWAERSPDTAANQFTGIEAHAYTLHHLLNQRLVIPIPDLWLAGLAAGLGRGVVLRLRQHQRQQRWTRRRQRRYSLALASTTALYGLVGLQTYIAAAVLLPWLLPSVAFWVYVLPTLRRKSNG